MKKKKVPKKKMWCRHTGIKCLKCGDEIFSMHRHDLRRCKCGACFVDGGFEYLRYGGDFGNLMTVTKRVPIE